MARLNSSLSATYVSTGQFDAFSAMNIRPWDILGACFLVEQNGGIVSNFDGSKWGIDSKNILLSGNKELHELLLTEVEKMGCKFISM